MKQRDLIKFLRGMKRIAVTGRPGVGKTTFSMELSRALGLPLYKTDDFIGRVDFSDVPRVVLGLLEGRSEWVVEGVQVSRMLGDGLDAEVVVLVERDIPVLGRHKGMARLVDSRVGGYGGRVIRLEL